MAPTHIETGKLGERIGVSYLKKIGYTIFEINYKTPFGEIDCIAKQGGVIVFIEIKTRRSNAFGMPEEAVDRKKQMKMIQNAQYYLKKNKLCDALARFDVLAVMMKAQNQVEFALTTNAFELESEF